VKEKKRILSEYQEETKIREEEERLAAEKKARAGFDELLKSSDWIDENSRFREFRDKVEDDQRFKAVESERDRKALFYEYVEELVEKARKIRQANRKENAAKLKAYLTSDECKWISADSTWRDAKEHKIEECPGAKDLENSDKIKVFEDVVRELREEEKDRKAREKEKRKKMERKLRDSFRELLQESLTKGEFHSKSLWDEVDHLFQEDERYKKYASVKKPKITPEEVFDDFTADLEERISSPKKRVKAAVKATIGTVKHDAKIEELQKAIGSHDEVKDLDEEDLKLAINEVIAKAKWKHREKEKKMRKYTKELEKDFRKYLARGYAENMDNLKKAKLEDAVNKCSSKMVQNSGYKKLDKEMVKGIFERIKGELLGEEQEEEGMAVENDDDDDDDMDDEKESNSKRRSRRRNKRKRDSDIADDDENDNKNRSEDDEGDKKKKRKKSSSKKKSKKKRKRRDDSRSAAEDSD